MKVEQKEHRLRKQVEIQSCNKNMEQKKLNLKKPTYIKEKTQAKTKEKNK